MKIDKLRKKIKYIIIFIILCSILIGGLMSLYFYINNSYLEQYEKITMDIANLKNQTSEIERKTNENKKYMELWSQIDSKKKDASGIKVEEINKSINSLAEKYSITTPILKLSVPENYPSKIFENETVSIIYSIIEVNFSSYNDIKSLQFTNDFLNTLHGYPILTKFECNKEEEYTVQDFFDISTGKRNGGVKCRLIISWYTYKEGPSTNVTK